MNAPAVAEAHQEATVNPGPVTITNRRACDLLGTHPRRVREMAQAGLIRTRQLPGCHMQYFLSDVLALVNGQRGETSK